MTVLTVQKLKFCPQVVPGLPGTEAIPEDQVGSGDDPVVLPYVSRPEVRETVAGRPEDTETLARLQVPQLVEEAQRGRRGVPGPLQGLRGAQDGGGAEGEGGEGPQEAASE